MENKGDEFAKSFISMDKRAAEYRGQYIQALNYIESTIDEAIVAYFCPIDKNKQDELMYAVFSFEKITLSNKYAIFTFLAERHCKPLYDQYNPPKAVAKALKKQNPKWASLDTRAGEVIKLRNQFAHRKFNYDPIEIFYGNQSTNISLDTKVAKSGQILDSPMQLNEQVMQNHLKEIRVVGDMIHKLSLEIKTIGLVQK